MFDAALRDTSLADRYGSSTAAMCPRRTRRSLA
jgi:hypothetical protein